MRTQVVTLRRTQKGDHPSKVYKYQYRNGEPVREHAQVLTVVGNEKVAVSMNGTAVFTPAEFEQWVNEVRNALVQTAVLEP